MPIFNQDAKQYESVRKELRDILIQKKVTNRFGEVVYLDYVPWETFHLEKARLFALYKYGARCSPKLGWTKEELEDMANNFVANVIGNEAVYGDGASSGSHHNHGGRIAKILAILLYCNCSSSPKLMPWKHLSQPASGPDAQRSDAAPLRDKNLPFKHDDLNRFFGEEVARDFEYEQTRFVSLVLSKGNTHHLHSTDSLHKLLPYKSEKLVGAGTFGAVYETVIFRGHFSEGRTTSTSVHVLLLGKISSSRTPRPHPPRGTKSGVYIVLCKKAYHPIYERISSNPIAVSYSREIKEKRAPSVFLWNWHNRTSVVWSNAIAATGRKTALTFMSAR